MKIGEVSEVEIGEELEVKLGDVLEVKVGEVKIGGAAMRSKSKMRGRVHLMEFRARQKEVKIWQK